MQEHSLVAQLVHFLLEKNKAVASRELNCYVVDNMALSQTRLSNDNQLEKYGDDFTFRRRVTGLWFGVYTKLMYRLSMIPRAIGDMLMALRLHHDGIRHTKLISVYTTTPGSDET